MGLEGGIQNGSLDQVMVCLGIELRLSQGNVGKDAPIIAAKVVNLGPIDGSICSWFIVSSVAHFSIPWSLFEMRNHALEVSIIG